MVFLQRIQPMCSVRNGKLLVAPTEATADEVQKAPQRGTRYKDLS